MQNRLEAFLLKLWQFSAPLLSCISGSSCFWRHKTQTLLHCIVLLRLSWIFHEQLWCHVRYLNGELCLRVKYLTYTNSPCE